MASFEAFSAPLASTSDVQIEMIVVVDVNDVKKLKDAMGAHNRDTTCIVSLESVAGDFHLRCAVNAAWERRNNAIKGRGGAKTSTFASEVAFRLAYSTNIQRVVEMNSVKDDSTAVAAIFVNPVDGTLAAFETVARECGRLIAPQDIAGLVTPEQKVAMVKEFKFTEAEVNTFPLQDCIVNKIATKDIK
jgi:hypothetical protein